MPRANVEPPGPRRTNSDLFGDDEECDVMLQEMRSKNASTELSPVSDRSSNRPPSSRTMTPVSPARSRNESFNSQLEPDRSSDEVENQVRAVDNRLDCKTLQVPFNLNSFA